LNESDNGDIYLVYDRECPVCEFYCQRIDVSPADGSLERVDAREDSPLMDEITSANLDIDAGMVLKVKGTLYYGSDAIHQLALRSSKKGFVNRLASALFRHPRIAKILYPALAACRNMLLKLLRRSRINNLGVIDNDRF
jgi:predicted DCC family thiol-disulfide oxidoreductase YuxK